MSLSLSGFFCQHGSKPTGKSEFGEVFLAKAQGVEEGATETLVLVKSLQSKDEQQQLDFRREVEMFGKLNHANVVRLLGLCREAEPHYMVLEYVDLVCCGVPGAGFGGGPPQRSWLLLALDKACLLLLREQSASQLSVSAFPFTLLSSSCLSGGQS